MFYTQTLNEPQHGTAYVNYNNTLSGSMQEARIKVGKESLYWNLYSSAWDKCKTNHIFKIYTSAMKK